MDKLSGKYTRQYLYINRLERNTESKPTYKPQKDNSLEDFSNNKESQWRRYSIRGLVSLMRIRDDKPHQMLLSAIKQMRIDHNISIAPVRVVKACHSRTQNGVTKQKQKYLIRGMRTSTILIGSQYLDSKIANGQSSTTTQDYFNTHQP